MPTLFICCLGILQPPSHPEEESSLNQCVYKLVERFIPNTLRIISYSSFTHLKSVMISHIHKENRWSITSDNINQNSFKLDTDKEATGFVILMRSSHQLNLVLRNLVANSNHRFLFILRQPIEKQVKIISKIMEPLFNETQINIEIIAPVRTNFAQNMVYTRTHHCGKPRKDIIQYCSFGIFSNKTLSVNKRKRTKRCSLKAVRVEFPPFTSSKNKGNGIEEVLLDTVAQFLNLNVTYIDVPYENKGYIYPNGTVIKSFLLLQNGSADVEIGGIALNEMREKCLQHTISYIIDHMSWCAPFKPILDYDMLLNTIQLITYMTIIYITMSFVMWCINNLEQRASPSYVGVSLLNILFVLFGVSVRGLPGTARLRFLTCLFASTALVLNIFYSSYVTGLLVSAKYDVRYKNFEDIYKDNLTTYSTIPVRNFLKNMEISLSPSISTEEVVKNLVICRSKAKCLKNVVENNSATYINKLSRDYLLKYRRIPYTPLIYCSEQSMYMLILAMFVREDFPLLHRFNRVIGRIINSGLIIKWRRDVNYGLRSYTYPDPMIELKHLLPIFTMYLGACALAIVIFMLEIIIGGNR